MIELFVTIELSNNRIISDYIQVCYSDNKVEIVEYEDQNITTLLTPEALSVVQEELDEFLSAEIGCGNDLNDR